MTRILSSKGISVASETQYHDTLFPYSELKNTLQTGVALKVTNGLSKIYVGAQYIPPHYDPGEPILIYRIHNGSGTKRYKSCLTSFCVVTDVIQAKQNYRIMLPFNDLLRRIGNKSVYDSQELKTKYDNDKNVVITIKEFAARHHTSRQNINGIIRYRNRR